jgi:hypothetical protein
MDGAEASCLYSAVGGMRGERVGRQRSASVRHEAPTSRRVAAVSAEGLGVSPSGAAVGADLGGSSKYSSEALED